MGEAVHNLMEAAEVAATRLLVLWGKVGKKTFEGRG